MGHTNYCTQYHSLTKRDSCIVMFIVTVKYIIIDCPKFLAALHAN